MNQLIVAGVPIRQDENQRYCLNDLHRSAGTEKRHAPSYWLSNQQTVEIVDELNTTGIPVVTIEGRNGGTFVCKELVYAYAMWISAKFHLHVIRAYDEMVTGGEKPKTALELAREQVALLERIEQVEHERDHAIATKAEIGTRREATAMNTASQAIKKANQLEAELDKSKQYYSVKRMQMIHHGQQFSWRLLKSTGIEMGIDPIDVFDANYGTVKAYHIDVWRETYAIDVQNAA